MNKKKMLVDAVLNIIASGVSVVALQLIVLPLIAHSLSTEGAYGLLITMVATITVISQTLGPLNNVRLLLNDDYIESGEQGDFNILILLFTGVGMLCTVIYSFSISGAVSWMSLLLLTITTGLMLLCGYFSVAFRLELDYKRILFSQVLQCMGYFVGLGLFYLTGYWEWVYLVGYLFHLLYIFKNTRLQKEPLYISAMFKSTVKYSFTLMLVSLLGSLLSYMDRLLLFPLIGGVQLSVYYAATVMGKMISMATTPIAGVMLSYFSKMKSIGQNGVTMVVASATGVGILGYIACIIVSPTILRIIYPQWAEEAIKLIYITTFTAVVNMVGSAIDPIILKFSNMAWRVGINAISIVTYLIISLYALKAYGLIGFCIGTLIAALIKVCMMLAVCYCPKGNRRG